VLDVPRSVRLAAWGTAYLRGEVPVEAAVTAVTRDDEPHEVGGGSAPAGVLDLATLLASLAQRASSLRVVLPIPGDVRGLPGPSVFNVAATDVGEGVLTDPAEPASAVGLVPAITEFGSAWEPGAMVTWHVHDVASRRVTDWGSLGEAERALRHALIGATEALASLDVARWREDAADRIASVRDGSLARDVVPPTSDQRAVRVLATAARVRAIVALASEDDGAAFSGWEATQRSRALSGVDGIARRAMAAAVDATLIPAR
jgi:hypothetical protein